MHKPLILKNLSLSLRHKICFEDFNVNVFPGNKIIITGNNGTGKTTLLKAINGGQTLIEGEINIPKGTVISYVPQIVENNGGLSGGERFNRALTAALSERPDILLLDEPTNHLDISNKKSLTNMLSRFNGTLIIVSHDIEVLRQANIIWHIDNGRINVFCGNYDDCQREAEIKRNSFESQLSSLEKEKKLMHRKLMQEQERAKKGKERGKKLVEQKRWLPALGDAKASSASKTSGNSRKSIFDKKENISQQICDMGYTEKITYDFDINAKKYNGTAVNISDGKAGYGSKEIISGINLSMTGSDKIAVIGNNASGKTTLFKAVMDKEYRLCGNWDIPDTGDIGYLDQHYDNISGDDTAVDIISKIKPGWKYVEIRTHLNDFLFRKNEEVNAKVSVLSGGERARLSLAAIAAKIPKLLLLDEITNNIDLQTRRHMEQMLVNYPSAMIVISHDTEFIRNIGITNIYLLENGCLKQENIENII